jgi:hypothetical protein
MCVQVESSAVTLPPLCVIRSAPCEETLVGTETETAVLLGTSESLMSPLTEADEDPPEVAGAELDPVAPDPVPVDVELLLEPPHAARSATPLTPAPSRSSRRAQLKVEGDGAALSDKTSSGWQCCERGDQRGGHGGSEH